MTDAEVAKRIAQVEFERGRGFYLDAVELERDLFRDLAGEVHEVYHEVSSGKLLGHCRRALKAHRALA